MFKRKAIFIILVAALMLGVAGSYVLFSKSRAETGNDENNPFSNYKTAAWVDENTKDKADITINYYDQADGILFLGTLCNGHSLAGGSHTIGALNQLLQRSDVDYAFFGTPTEEVPADGTTEAGLIPRSTYLKSISDYNTTSSYIGASYLDYSQYDQTSSSSAKNVYLLGPQASHGSKTKGQNMGVTYLSDLTDDNTGDHLHLWYGYEKDFTLTVPSSGNERPFRPNTIDNISNAEIKSRVCENQSISCYNSQNVYSPPSLTTLHFTNNFILSAGQHANAVAFAKEIVAKLDGPNKKEYDAIILSFDDLFEMANVQKISDDEAKIMRHAAELLEDYYNNDKVLWLMSAQANTIGSGDNEHPVLSFMDSTACQIEQIDSTTGQPVMVDNPDRDTFLCHATEGPQGDSIEAYTNYYLIPNAKYLGGVNQKGMAGDGTYTLDAYDSFTFLSKSPISFNYMKSANAQRPLGSDNNKLARTKYIPKFYWTRNMFQTMALFDPETYIYNTNTNGVPNNKSSLPSLETGDVGTTKWKTANGTDGELAAVYSDKQKIVNAYSKMVTYNKYIIEDTLKDGLIFNDTNPVEVKYYDETNNTWYTLNNGSDYSYVIDPTNSQKITITVTASVAIEKPIRAILHCDCPGRFDENGADKDTNEGEAKVTTYNDDKKIDDETYPSPKLLKKFKLTTTKEPDDGGTITPSDDNVLGGTTKVVEYSPNPGYRITRITIDGTTNVDINDYQNSFTFSNIDANHSVHVVFTPVEDVKITKDSTGTGADSNEYFPIRIKIYGNTDWHYTLTGLDANATCTGVIDQPTMINGQTPETVCLKDGQTVTIADVGTGIQVEAEEVDHGDYTSSVIYCDNNLCINAAGHPKTTFDNTLLTSSYYVLSTSTYGNSANEITFVNSKGSPPVTVDYRIIGDAPNGSPSVPESERIEYDSPYTQKPGLADGTYDHRECTFNGWYSNETLSTRWVDGTHLTNNLVLYGAWNCTSQPVTVDYQIVGDAPSGSPSVPASENVEYNSPYTQKPGLADGTYDGKTCSFNGWYTNTELTTRWTDGTALTSDMTLYGAWNCVNQPVTVSYQLVGDAPSGSPTVPADETKEYGSQYTQKAKLPDGTYDGKVCTFNGWYTNTELTTTWIDGATLTNNLTLYGAWNCTNPPVSIDYQIIGDAPSGSPSAPASETKEYGSPYTQQEKLANGFYGGKKCMFNGWYLDRSYTTTWDDGDPVYSNLHFYGSWSCDEVVNSIYKATTTGKTKLGEEFTYVIANNVPELESNMYYKSYQIIDELESAIVLENTNNITITANGSDVTNNFNIDITGKKVTITAKDTSVASFYGKNYEIAMTVYVDKNADLSKYKQGNKYVIPNKAKIIVTPADGTATCNDGICTCETNCTEKESPEVLKEVGSITISYVVLGQLQPNAKLTDPIPTPEEILSGTKYTARPGLTTKDTSMECIFNGWYKDSSLKTKYADGTELEEDLTLYGGWTCSKIVKSPDTGISLKILLVLGAVAIIGSGYIFIKRKALLK